MSAGGWGSKWLRVAGLLVVGGLGWVGGMQLEKAASRRALLELEAMKSHYLWEEGATSSWPASEGQTVSYRFVSLDGGKLWYAVDPADWDRVRVVGLADEVHPGLLEHVRGEAASFRHVQTKGPTGAAAATHGEVAR